MLIRGYDVNTCTNLPVQPYSNIHCELFDVLLAVKVRHSRSKALFVTSNANIGEGVKDWQMLVQYINDALNTYQVVTSKDILVQLEFLVLKGKMCSWNSKKRDGYPYKYNSFSFFKTLRS